MNIPTEPTGGLAKPLLPLAAIAAGQGTEWLRITLASIGDGVISTDAEGRITFMNGAAEALTGWTGAEAHGRPLPEVFHIIDARTRERGENPVLRALREKTVVGLANHTLLIARDGREVPIGDSAGPMISEAGVPIGAVVVFRDVSKSKQAQESQARLAAIVESSDDAIVSKTLDGVIRSWNAGAERLFGYTPEEAIGRPITLIIPPERDAEEPAILERLRRGERVDHFETVRVAKDGRRLDISLTISPVRDEEGRVIGASKVARDITERKRTEAALRESDEKLRLMADTIPQMAWMARPDGHIFWYNRRWYEYTGTTPEEVEGWGWQSVHDPDVLPSVLERWRGSLASGAAFDMVFPLRGADGLFRPFLTRINPLRNDDGRILYWFGTNTDISEQKQAEERLGFLADASAALADVVDSERTLNKVARLAVPFFADWCAVDMIQTDGGLRRLATTQAELLRKDAAQRTDRPAPLPHDDSAGPARVVRSGESEMGAEIGESVLAALARDADQLQFLRRLGLHSYICVPLATRGRTLGAMTFALSGSGRRYGPAELKLAQDLAHRAAVATENARLYGELREADRRKDEFIALLAHELRNPLAPIRNGLQVMRLSEGDASAVAQARGILERQLGHMVRLIDDLLDISRISRNKMELRRSRVLLADVVSSAVETSRPIIEAARHELTVSLPTEPVCLDADLTRLAQVFGNLLTNSAKYTERGGRIWLSATREGNQVAVTVRDSGIGIPAFALPQLFDMFSQVDRSLERSAGGLGIGLALVKGLVEMHGGTVEATSPGQGKGSTFTVRLPVLESRTEASEAPVDASERVSLPRRRILVVDDNRDSAHSLSLLLKLVGNEVRTVHDGLEAVEAAERFRPQVILMDVGMPRLNGYEATRRIREQAWSGSVIIIAVTGWGQEVDKLRSRAAGCHGHLVKPVQLSDLEKLLAELTGGHVAGQF
ncbi:MAG: PAS domain S-box protein [Gemmataceae bacterium]